MKLKQLLLIAGSLAVLAGQSGSNAILTNLATAKWVHGKADPPESESVLLRQDSRTGGMELIVRFPGGHVITPHWHDSNERIIVLEGQLTLRQDSGETSLDTGGFAFLPAQEVQRMSCSSKTRCTFYLSWDGKPDSHAAK
jgi:quercetin dioxygenase-like cupin family protein